MIVVLPYDVEKFIKFQNALEKRMINVGENLPLIKKILFLIIWKDIFTKQSMSTSNAFNWRYDKPRDAIIINKII
jgi:hypothetical protein